MNLPKLLTLFHFLPLDEMIIFVDHSGKLLLSGLTSERPFQMWVRKPWEKHHRQ